MSKCIEIKSFNFELDVPVCVKLDDLEYHLVFTREHEEYIHALFKSSDSVDYLVFKRYKL